MVLSGPEASGRVSTRRVAAAASLLLLVALALGEGFVREYSGDFHWHVVQGEQTLREHRIAATDSFSHTYAGRPFANTAWLGDVLLALAFRAGYPGVYVLRSLALLALVLLLAREGKRAGLSVASAALLAALPLVHAPLQRYLRPELFALVCLAALLHLLGEHERRPRRALLVGALALVLLWANLHASVSLGLLAFGCYAGERGLRCLLARPRDLRAALVWAAWPVAALLLACVSPQGLAGPLAFRIMRRSWIALTPDWQPLPAWPPLLAAVALATLVLVVAAGRRVSWWRLVVALVLAYFAARYRRGIVPALIAAVPLQASCLVVVRERLAARGAARRGTIVGGAVGLGLALWAALVVLVDARLAREVGIGVDPGAYPEAACAWARATPALSGEMLNSGPLGSFLMWCLPEHRVFHDQRTWSLYDESFFLAYLEAARDPERLEALVERHHVGWAFTQYDTLATTIGRRPELWRLVYFDDQAQVWVRPDRNPGLAAQGFVWLEPGRLGSLPGLSGEHLAQAGLELARQQARCPACTRTLLARVAMAIAARDEPAYHAALDALLARGETAEVAFLAARHAEAHADWSSAAELHRRVRLLGGDPVSSRLFEARDRHRAGDHAGAAALLDEVERLPGASQLARRLRAELAASP